MTSVRRGIVGLVVASASVWSVPGGVRAEVVGRADVSSTGEQGPPAFFPALSASGRFVSFSSFPGNLAPPCTNSILHVFLHDRSTGQTECATVHTNGTPASSNALGPLTSALSADGRLVFFISDATNLVTPPFGASATRLYVRDRLLGTTTFIAPVDSTSFAITPDGRFVAYVINAGFPDVICQKTGSMLYLLDRQGPTTTCLTVSNGSGTLSYGGLGLSLSADGRFAAFSGAEGSVGAPCFSTPATFHIFVRDRVNGTTECASVSSSGTPGNANSQFPTISADGHYVVFSSAATNLVFPLGAGQRVFVRNRVLQTTTLVSADGGNASDIPAVSADGRFILFQTSLPGVSLGCANTKVQILAHDRHTGITSCLSVTANGTAGNGDSDASRISADGRVAVFTSQATNLVTPDANGTQPDVFVARLPVGPNWLVTGPGAGGGPHVRGFDATGTPTLLSTFPYPPGFTGGVRVATGDVNGDGAPDVIVGAGPGGGPHVRVLGGSVGSTDLGSFFAYDPAFSGGVYVAAGRIPSLQTFVSPTKALIVTGAGAGGGPHVRVFAGDGTPVVGFFAYGPGFTGGVRVAACDVDGDGFDEIVTAPGPGGGPHVIVWPLDITPFLQTVVEPPLAQVFAYDPGFTGGVYVACGDLTGDGKAEVVTGAGEGGGAHVRVWRYTGGALQEIAGFFAYAPGFTGGVRVGVGDVNGDGKADIITAAGPGGGPHIRVFSGAALPGLTELASFFAYAPGFTGGVFPAGFLP